MDKRIKILMVILFILAAVTGGYFLAKRKGILPKGKISYTRPITELREEKNIEIIEPEAIIDANGEKQADEKIVSDNKNEVVNNRPQVTGAANDQNIDSSKNLPVKSTNKQSGNNPDKKVEAATKTDDSAKQDDSSENIGKIVSKPVTWGFQKAESRTISAIIIHTSYNALGGDPFDLDKVIQEWKDAGVSPHYTIDRDGVIYQLVSDKNIAYHAGTSKLPDGTTDVNGVSIGIEVINTQDGKFTDDQYDALNSLIASLKKKYEIKYVLGHDDVAPGRKSDPWGIEWEKVKK